MSDTPSISINVPMPNVYLMVAMGLAYIYPYYVAPPVIVFVLIILFFKGRSWVEEAFETITAGDFL